MAFETDPSVDPGPVNLVPGNGSGGLRLFRATDETNESEKNYESSLHFKAFNFEW